MSKEFELRRNFISVDRKFARNSYGTYFEVGERVKHDDTKAGEATIIAFKLDPEKNEVRAETEMGYAHLDFLVKIVPGPGIKDNCSIEDKFDPRAEADKIILRLGSQKRAVADFFRKTPYTGINEVYTNLDEQGLYLSKDDAVRNSSANEQGHKAFITWLRK